MRKLLRLVLLLVVLVAVAVGVALYYVDSLAGTGIERGATYALGVPATVHEADVGLLGGTLRVDRLTVANPEGFKTPHLVAVKRLDLGCRPGSDELVHPAADPLVRRFIEEIGPFAQVVVGSLVQ